MEFDELLEAVGSFGRCQRVLLAWITCAYVVSTVHFFVQVFYAGRSDHWCSSWPEDDCSSIGVSNEYVCEMLKRNLSVPFEGSSADSGGLPDGPQGYDQCLKYNFSDMNLGDALELFEGNFTVPEIIPCDQGWEFDRTTYPSTIVIDFELVCDRSFLPNIAQSIYFAGYMIGSILGGALADRFGRRPTILFMLFAMTICGSLLAASPNIWVYAALRFLLGVVVRTNTLVLFVLSTEFVPSSYRNIVAVATFICVPLGYIAFVGLAKILPNWRFVQLSVTAPNLPILFFAIFILLESPRWLLSRGRTTKADSVCRKVARRNNKEVPDNFSDDLIKIEKNNEERRGSVLDLFRSRITIFIVIIMSFNWFVHSLVYFGLSFSTDTFNIDPHLSFALSAVVEIPAYAIQLALADKVGRRLLSTVCMVIAGAAACSSPLVPLGIYRALLVSAGKLSGTVAFSMSYTWAAEVTPTYLRTTGIGVFSLVSRVGGIIVPLLLLLESTWVSLPMVIIGGFSIIGGLLCLLLPETRKKPLPTTIKDVEDLYRKEATTSIDDHGTTNPAADTITADEDQC